MTKPFLYFGYVRLIGKSIRSPPSPAVSDTSASSLNWAGVSAESRTTSFPMSAPTAFRLLMRLIGSKRMFDDRNGAREDFAGAIGGCGSGHQCASFSFYFLKSLLPPGGIGFVQTVNDRREQIRESQQLDLKIGS